LVTFILAAELVLYRRLDGLLGLAAGFVALQDYQKKGFLGALERSAHSKTQSGYLANPS